MISTSVFAGLVWRIGAVMEASLRMLSLRITLACCPRLRRLGALVLQEAPSPEAGVAPVAAVFVTASVEVESGETVGVDLLERGVDVSKLTALVEVAASVGGRGDGARVSVADGAETVSVNSGNAVNVSVLFETGEVSVIPGGISFGTALVAHPRRSMRRRIAPRMRLTMSLNRSSPGALARFMVSPVPAGEIARLLQQRFLVGETLNGVA